MSRLASDIMLWWMSLTTILVFGAFALKSHAHKTWVGKFLLWLLAALALIGCYIIGARLDLISNEWRNTISFWLFGIFACALTANLILLLKRNWNFWAWSPGEEPNDKSSDS